MVVAAKMHKQCALRATGARNSIMTDAVVDDDDQTSGRPI